LGQRAGKRRDGSRNLRHPHRSLTLPTRHDGIEAMTADDIRRIALQLPGATEKSHFGKPDFRVRDRVFATLPEDGNVVIKLSRDQQEVMCGAEAAMFQPVAGGWAKRAGPA
jgi:hypothetical protein